MDAREIGERVLELLGGIDLEQPDVDEALAADRLQAYVEALGLRTPRVRFAPDVRALHVSRTWPGQDRGHWRAFFGRQAWLLDRSLEGGWRFTGRRREWTGWPIDEPTIVPGRLARTDRTVLEVALGRARNARGVRQVTEALELLGRLLTAGSGLPTPNRVEAFVPLAEAARAGLFSVSVGKGDDGDLVGLLRPKMRLDEEGRLHHWDGLPAVEWPNGEGLYFWHGVEMTKSAGTSPWDVTPGRVLRWANAERRRVAIERMGTETFMKAVGARVVQEDDYGKLWRTEIEVDGEPFVAVEVVNATEEPDGTRRTYFLRVPPGTRTARKGVAWSFGLTRSEYVPAVES